MKYGYEVDQGNNSLGGGGGGLLYMSCFRPLPKQSDENYPLACWVPKYVSIILFLMLQYSHMYIQHFTLLKM